MSPPQVRYVPFYLHCVLGVLCSESVAPPRIVVSLLPVVPCHKELGQLRLL